jgi:hypothetical protein
MVAFVLFRNIVLLTDGVHVFAFQMWRHIHIIWAEPVQLPLASLVDACSNPANRDEKYLHARGFGGRGASCMQRPGVVAAIKTAPSVPRPSHLPPSLPSVC